MSSSLNMSMSPEVSDSELPSTTMANPSAGIDQTSSSPPVDADVGAAKSMIDEPVGDEASKPEQKGRRRLVQRKPGGVDLLAHYREGASAAEKSAASTSNYSAPDSKLSVQNMTYTGAAKPDKMVSTSGKKIVPAKAATSKEKVKKGKKDEQAEPNADGTKKATTKKKNKEEPVRERKPKKAPFATTGYKGTAHLYPSNRPTTGALGMFGPIYYPESWVDPNESDSESDDDDDDTEKPRKRKRAGNDNGPMKRTKLPHNQHDNAPYGNNQSYESNQLTISPTLEPAENRPHRPSKKPTEKRVDILERLKNMKNNRESAIPKAASSTFAERAAKKREENAEKKEEREEFLRSLEAEKAEEQAKKQ